MSIAESPRHPDTAPAQGWEGLSASFGILSSAAASRQDVLGGLHTGAPLAGEAQQAQQAGGELDQLTSRFAAAVALDHVNSDGAGRASGNSTPQPPPQHAGSLDASADPFAAASRIVSSLHRTSPSSEWALQGRYGQGKGLRAGQAV